MNINEQLCREFSMQTAHINNIVILLDEDNTVPFIARYRKEMTGGVDDQKLREIADRLIYLRNLEKRKEEVRQSITEQQKMTDEISEALNKAETLTEVEDIYRPFKPKRRTRATIAVEAGLQPLADIIMEQNISLAELDSKTLEFINEEKNITDSEKALAGALDIIAEAISDNAEMRKVLREATTREGMIAVKANKECPAGTYDMYKEYSEVIFRMPSHRILAVNRGEKDEFLSVKITFDENKAYDLYNAHFIIKDSKLPDLIKRAVTDSYDRLIKPSIEREIRSEMFDKAAEQAIKMFEVNLRPLLLQPPVKDKTVMGLDPGYRTGCKVAVVDGTGKVLDHTIIYPTHGENMQQKSKQALTELIVKNKVDLIAIGNGTASKETEIFAADVIRDCGREVFYTIVNEAGASVYSASKLASVEFPDFDVTTRSAISIARRLQDPLAELIKIDPKSIGVGQYQHDMPEKRLDDVLSGVVEDCVNSVGVDVNTASPQLLGKVAGINAGAAKEIVAYREKNGKFIRRQDFLKVPKIGEKAYAQCAGFLRIPGGENLLDNTAVHPESYETVFKLLDKYNLKKKDLNETGFKLLSASVERDGIEKTAKEINAGVPTLIDIIGEIAKPGRDIRDELPKPVLRADIMSIKDLTQGMTLTGTVRNVIDFGVFVDIGVHQDGLVHISEIANRYIKHPSEALKVGDTVKVRILGVDTAKNRISLSIKQAE